MKDLTPETFEAAINTDKILVDFYAPWCGPCKFMKPVLEKLSETYNIAAYDVDQVSELSEKYQIRGVPTLILFKNGIEAGRIVGVVNETRLTDLLNS